MINTSNPLNQTKCKKKIPPRVSADVKAALMSNGVPFIDWGSEITINSSDIDKVNDVVNGLLPPNLLPSQFYWVIIKLGLEEPIDNLMAMLKVSDPDKYSLYNSFLKGARYYEYIATMEILDNIRPFIEQQYPELDIAEATVKDLWLRRV